MVNSVLYLDRVLCNRSLGMAEHITLDEGQFERLIAALHPSQDSIGTLSILHQILTLLQSLKAQGDKIMATLDEVLADVQDEKTKIDSLVALLAGIKAQLDAILAGNIPPALQAKVDAVFSAVETNKAEVQAAIDANTPPTP